MPEFIVEVATKGRAYYLVEAETASEAYEHWDEGQLLDRENLDFEVVDVRLVKED